MKPLNLLLISTFGGDHYPLTLPELTLCRFLKKQGHQITLVLSSDGKFASCFRELGIKIIIRSYVAHPRKLLNRCLIALELEFFKKRLKHIDCIAALRLRASYFANRLGRRSGIPVVTCLHSIPSPDHRPGSRYLRHSVQESSAVLAVSKAALSHYLQAIHPLSNEQRHVVIHNGIEVDAFRRAAEEFDARARFGVPRDVIVVGMAGPYHGKGLDTLISAAERIAHPNIYYLIAGKFRDDSYRRLINAQLTRTKLTKRFIFAGLQANMAALMRGCDIWAFPTRFNETFGMVALEAMSLGIPVVASRTGGVPEIITDQETGYLHDVDDFKSLAQHIDDLAKNPTRRKRIGESGYSHVKKHFHLNERLSAIEQVFFDTAGI